MYKVTDKLSFKRDAHGYKLTQVYDTVHPKTKEPSQSSRDTFHSSLDQVAGKILHLAMDDTNVELELEDMRNVFFSCKAEIAMMLKQMEESV
jgi:ATP-dependent protease HslVU (ClpYQ) ATPase subunit